MAHSLTDVHNDNEKERSEAFEINREDGLILAVVKLFFGHQCIAWLFRAPYWFVVGNIAHLLSRWKFSYDDKTVAKLTYKWLVDGYNLIWLAGLLTLYWWAYATQAALPGWVAWACVIGSVYRILENYSGLVQLHVREGGYKTSTPVRAVVLALVVYAQHVIAFGTLFLVTALSCPDSFTVPTKPCLQSEFSNALYFSFVTITTLGYGDFSPTCWQGRLLVICAVSTGIIVIVVAVQRTIMTTQLEPRRQKR